MPAPLVHLLQTLDGVALAGSAIASVHADLTDPKLQPGQAVPVSSLAGPIYRVRVDVAREFFGAKPRRAGEPAPERWNPNGAIDPVTGRKHTFRSAKGVE